MSGPIMVCNLSQIIAEYLLKALLFPLEEKKNWVTPPTPQFLMQNRILIGTVWVRATVLK